MNFIKIPPKDVSHYRIVERNDYREKFIESALSLFDGNVSKITTGSIPIGWSQELIDRAKSKGYNIQTQQVLVNQDEPGSAHAIYYFERII